MKSGRRLVLHIGTIKSGTTYLQRMLTRQSEVVGAHGWTYPLNPPVKGQPAHNQEYAMFGLLGPRIPWISTEQAARLEPQWQRLHASLASCEGPVLLSSESLATLDVEGIRHLIDRLAHSDVQVIVTLRDLARIIPSSWQQHVRNGRLASFAEYMDAIESVRERAGDRSEGVNFWRSYRLEALVERWAGVVGVGQVTLVTSPRQGAPDVLWRRFIEGCGLPDALAEVTLPLDRHESHQSVSWPMAIALQRMAKQWADGGIEYTEIKRRMRALERAVGLAEDGPPIRIPADRLERVRGWAEHDVAAARATGVRLVGDWADLHVADSRTDSLEPTQQQIEQAWLRVKQAAQAG